MSFNKQAMVLNYQTIFQANNGFELLNHVSSKKSISYKTGLTKIPSFKQAYRLKVFYTCTVLLGHHFMHFRFTWSTNLVHVRRSWHLLEYIGLARQLDYGDVDQGLSIIFTGKGDVGQGPST